MQFYDQHKMDASSTASCINGGYTDTNVASQACFSSRDKKLIDSNHSTEIRNGDYIDVKENVFTAPSRIHNKIIMMGDGTKKLGSDEMDVVR